MKSKKYLEWNIIELPDDMQKLCRNLESLKNQVLLSTGIPSSLLCTGEIKEKSNEQKE